MIQQRILVPYNFTENDRKALNYVIRVFKKRDDVEVTLFHGYTPAPEIDVKNNPVMETVAKNLSYLRQKIQESETEIAAVRDLLIQNGFSPGRVRTLFQPAKRDIAQDIVDIAQADRYDTIVLNRTSGKILRFFTGNVFTRVVTAVKDVAILIVT